MSGYVVENVKRLRADHRWSLAELSAEMSRVGRPMLASGLNRIEQGKRRVDADDLVGLALALRVAPITLLLPPVSTGQVELTEKAAAEARAVWDWMIGKEPLHRPEDDGGYERLGFLRRSWPPGMVKYDQTAPAGLEGWADLLAQRGQIVRAASLLEEAGEIAAEDGNEADARRLLVKARKLAGDT